MEPSWVGLVTLEKGPKRSFVTSAMWGCSEEMAVSEKVGSDQTESAGAMILDFPASRAVTNVIYKPPSCFFVFFLAIPAQMDYDNRLTTIY